MTIAVLTPSHASFIARPKSPAGLPDVLERIAMIVRRYATDRVAIRGGAVEIDLSGRRLPGASDEERARRLAVLAGSWTGSRVSHQLREPSAPSADRNTNPQPCAVSIVVREGETAASTVARVERALQRLAVIAEAQGAPVDGFVLRLSRGAHEAVMPLSVAILEAESLHRWLPPAAMRGVSGIRLETRVRRVQSRPRQTPRNPVDDAATQVLSRVS